MKNLLPIVILSLILLTLSGCIDTNVEKTNGEPRVGEIDGRGENLPKAELITVAELKKRYEADKNAVKGKQYIIEGQIEGTMINERGSDKASQLRVTDEGKKEIVQCNLKESKIVKLGDKVKIQGKFEYSETMSELALMDCFIIK